MSIKPVNIRTLKNYIILMDAGQVMHGPPKSTTEAIPGPAVKTGEAEWHVAAPGDAGDRRPLPSGPSVGAAPSFSAPRETHGEDQPAFQLGVALTEEVACHQTKPPAKSCVSPAEMQSPRPHSTVGMDGEEHEMEENNDKVIIQEAMSHILQEKESLSREKTGLESALQRLKGVHLPVLLLGASISPVAVACFKEWSFLVAFLLVGSLIFWIALFASSLRLMLLSIKNGSIEKKIRTLEQQIVVLEKARSRSR